MCGIAGMFNLDGTAPACPEQLERMAGVLAHRGPDDQGLYVAPDRQCGLGHRRLSILDLQGGHQPMCNEKQTVWICFNGQCYNYRQLRRRLESQGHHFKTRSDTEVLVHLYEQYGPDCANHIRGMFALAIWDQRKKSLFLARDRMGQKPLYYAMHKGRLIFASESKAILQVPDFPRKPNLLAIKQYLLFGYVPHPATAFDGIRQLPPAHYLYLQPGNTSLVPKRYWSLPSEPTSGGSMEDAVTRLKTELAEAVSLRMVSDVPLGAFLSGGLDSSIVVGLMSRASSESVKTCSMGFEQSAYNELPYARLAARHFNCDHIEKIVLPDCQETIEKLSYFYDEPFADSSALPTFHLSHLARQRVTVALSGDGADECFGGYDRYKALALSQSLYRMRLFRRLAEKNCWSWLAGREYRSRTRNIKRFLEALNLPVDRRYLQWISVFQPEHLRNILKQEQNIESIIPDQMQTCLPSDSGDAISQAMAFDGRFYLPCDLNTKVDRAGMSIGLEIRSPFQDHKVVELAYSLPREFRLKGRTGKAILRQAYRKFLPDEILRRKKKGFGIPVGQWFRNELRDLFMDTVLSDRALQRGYFDPAGLERLLSEQDQGIQDHGHRMWSLLMLELWHRRFIDSCP